MAKKPIGVRVIMPTTAEGNALLDRAMTEFNSRMLACALNAHPEIPYEAKVKFVKSLNGVVPWARERAEANA